MARCSSVDSDLPPYRQLAHFRHEAHMRPRRCTRRGLALGCFGVALLAATMIWKPAPRLLWNVSESAPVGLYGVFPDEPLRRGDMVAAHIPESMRHLAAERRYLPANVPLVKRIAAVEGDHVCAIGASVFVNGNLKATRLNEDGRGRTMPWWTGCEALGHGRFLLLVDEQATSFDGRYFGPVASRQIIGKAVLLWAR